MITVQCSQISWFITNSAILGMVPVTIFCCSWQVTRALKSVILGNFPEKWENPTIFAQKIPKFFTQNFRPKLFQNKFVIFPRFWGLLLVIFVIFRVFFCSWFSWLFCLEVGIFKKNHLGTLVSSSYVCTYGTSFELFSFKKKEINWNLLQLKQN